MVHSFTRQSLLALTSYLAIIATWSFAAGKAKEYENFDLPQAKSSSVPESSGLYTGSRIQVTGRNVKIREASFNAQNYVFAKEAYLAEKRDEAIKLLRQELDSGLKRNRDNLLLRLGQLYSEKYMELSYRENELYTISLQEYEKAKNTDKNAKAPKLDNSRSQKYLTEALGLFLALEKEFPQHPKLDEILFFIGFVQMETGKTETGMKYLERVVRQYPKSRKYEEAVVYLGDHYFEKIKFREALARYKILTVRKESPLYHYALYKIAWCELNTGEGNKGLRDMKELVASLKGIKETSKFNLREQALKDLVVFYGETGNVDEAIEYFTDNQNKDKALENLKLIADILRSKARDEAAIKAYTMLVDEFPNSLETPKLYLGLYESQSRLGRSDAAVKTLNKALDTFHPGSGWAKNLGADKAEVKSSLEQVAGEAEKIAFFYHSSGQKSSNRNSLGHALNIYRSLLTNFPALADKKKISFYMGEIFYAEGKWLDAANSYMTAAQTLPKDKMADEAAYNALLALDRLTAKNDNLERYSKEDQKTVDLTPQEIPANEKRFIEVAEYYLKEYPQGSRVVDVHFRVAAIYYRYHHFDKSQDLFKQLALKYPFHKSATTAAHIVLDIYNLKKDYAALDATAKMFAKTDRLGDATFRAEMAQLSGELEFKNIESLEASNKWKEAGQTYYEYYKKNPTGGLGEKALYNAYVSFEKANDTVMASETSRVFVNKFPKSEYTKKFTLNLARLAEKQYDFDQAQKLYGEFAKKFPDDKEARKALYNAALFAELLEKNKLAGELYDEYLKGKSTITADERKSIAISQAKLFRKDGQWDKMNIVYRRLVKDAANTAEKILLLGELARAYERGGKVAERTAVVKEIRYLAESNKGVKLAGPAVAFLAEAKFREVAPDRERYEKKQLRLSDDFQYLLSTKQKALVKLAAKYDGVVEVGVPDWGVAALYEKYDAFNNFVEGFRKLQIPAKYKGEERAQVEKLVKDLDTNLVKPLEAKAKDFLKACVSKASEFYVANEYAIKCRQRTDKSVALIEPSGVLPQPSYWTTRWTGEGVAKR